jgi:hypothetical protein
VPNCCPRASYVRAYALAALAVQEFGKAMGVMTLVPMSDNIEALPPVTELLEWHPAQQIGYRRHQYPAPSFPALRERPYDAGGAPDR